jgi:hypothetical protein
MKPLPRRKCPERACIAAILVLLLLTLLSASLHLLKKNKTFVTSVKNTIFT